MAIGNPEIREKIYRRLARPASLIHPTAFVNKSAQIGAGCVIEANAIVNEFCQIDCNAVVAMGVEVLPGMKVYSCSVFNKKNGNF